MTITASALIADIAASSPATIKVFQRHRIDFCCGGKVALSDVCQRQHIDTEALIGELDAALSADEVSTDWTSAPLVDLVGYIQRRFHRPLEEELPRLGAMLDKVVSRHGARLPDTLLPLQATFAEFQNDLVAHMAREDAVLFPSLVAIEAASARDRTVDWTWIDQPIALMEAEHASAGAALARMAELTGGYVPPEDACPTFRGLYYGLWELEREMQMHVHLENHILFPRAAALAALSAAGSAS